MEISQEFVDKYCNGVVPTGRIFNIWEHRGWGNKIGFMGDQCREIGGAFRGLRVGDEIRWKNDRSDRVVRCKLISKIRYCDDPRDCFFGDLVEGSSFGDKVVIADDGRLALGKKNPKGSGPDVCLDYGVDSIPAERG